MARGPEFSVGQWLAQKQGLGSWFQDLIDADTDPAAFSGVLVTAGEEPTRPDDAIYVLRSFGGELDAVGVQETHLVEVHCRSASYETAFTLASQVSNTLHRAQGDIGGLVMLALAQGAPASLGRDRDGEGGRWVTTQVFRLLLTQGQNTTPTP